MTAYSQVNKFTKLLAGFTRAVTGMKRVTTMPILNDFKAWIASELDAGRILLKSEIRKGVHLHAQPAEHLVRRYWDSTMFHLRSQSYQRF